MSREEAYEQAALCYRQAGYNLEAARCYGLVGAYRRAAEIYEAEGLYPQAATSFGEAGLPEIGAWLLAHRASLPAQARALLRVPGPETGQDTQPRRDILRRRLVIARCEIGEGAGSDIIRPVIADVCSALATTGTRADHVIEEWAVTLSEAAARYDQAALVFAASVRGGRYGAERRWKAWSVRVLGAEIVVPAVPSAKPATTTAA